MNELASNITAQSTSPHGIPAATIKLHTTARQALRFATDDVHQRLHLHPGFAAVQARTIDRVGYIALLSRLYGFYLPFEPAASVAPDRSGWLAEDLGALGLDAPALAALPVCGTMPRLDTPARRTGALYVVEGSALGGRELANHVASQGGDWPNRFFTGRGVGTGAAWKLYLAGLASLDGGDTTHASLIDAALETFAVFEDWLSGWDSN